MQDMIKMRKVSVRDKVLNTTDAITQAVKILDVPDLQLSIRNVYLLIRCFI